MTSWRSVVSMALLAGLTGCGGAVEPEASDPEPVPGARRPPSSTPPSRPMDDLERTVAERLEPALRDEGLTLVYVDCPGWRGAVPFETECQGYVDGVVADVEVVLSRASDGSVEFDAWLDEGVVATSRLVRRLEEEGWTDVDCGRTPAYPAEVGLRIVCRVHQRFETSYVVATVTGRRGQVDIVER